MAVSVAQGLSLLGSATAVAYTYGSYHDGESEVLRRSPPQANGIQFVCSDFPDVCQNMCWGKCIPCACTQETNYSLCAFCVDKHTEFLTYDKASASVKRARRKAAGCLDNQKPGNNRCSAGRPGAQPNYNCDEYPSQAPRLIIRLGRPTARRTAAAVVCRVRRTVVRVLSVPKDFKGTVVYIDHGLTHAQ